MSARRRCRATTRSRKPPYRLRPEPRARGRPDTSGSPLRASLERVVDVGILADPNEDHRVARIVLRDLGAGSGRTGRAWERFDKGRLTTELRTDLGLTELATEYILRPRAPANADVVRQCGGVVNGGCAERRDRALDQARDDRPT